MSEIVAEAIIQKRQLKQFAETFHSKVSGMKSPLVSEAKIHFGDDGLTTTAVDAANVGMVGPANLAPRAFEHYDAPGSVTIGISLSTLLERIGPANSSQLIEMEVDMETRHLHLKYGSANMSVALIDPASIRAEPDIPDLELPNTVVLSGGDLSRAIEITDMVSDHLYLKGRPDEREVHFVGQGDTDDNTVEYGDEETLDGTKVTGEVESVFSSDYMKALAKPIPDDAEVTIHFGDEYPVKMEWEAFDGAFTTQQTLAPRIQSD